MKHLLPLAFLALGACATPPKAYIPVDSPLKQWEPPEADAYVAEPPEPEPAPAPAKPPTAAKEPKKAAADKK